MIELKRNDPQYLAVENFKDYELTHCIAYEMAIRNDEVIKTVKSFIDNYIKYEVTKELHPKNLILSTLDFTDSTAYYSNKLQYFYIDPLQLYLNYSFYDEVNKLINKQIDYEKLIEENFLKECKEKKKTTNRPNINLLSSRIFQPREDNYSDTFNNKSNNENIIYEYSFTSLYDSTMVYEYDPKTDFKIIKSSDIQPCFSRPLAIDYYKSKQRRVDLNLAVPVNELIDFIEKLKNEIDGDKNAFKTFSELIDNLEVKDITNYSIDGVKTQEKFADMFYIYDCLKLGYTHRKIQDKVYNYYADKGIETRTLSDKTLAKYRDLITPYIDEEQYKELITGLRNN